VEGPSVTGARIPKRGQFDENLADIMDSGERKLLAMRLCEFARDDKMARKDWEEREKRCLIMLGIKDIPKESDQEPGHNVTHPALMEAAVRFQSNAITELFPPNGPAETKVLGTTTAAKMARAKRVRTFLNHYLLEKDDGYFNDTDQMMMYLPMGGSALRRAGQDYTTGLPVLRYIQGTKFIAPYSGTDLKSMPRYAWEYTMTGEDMDRAMRIGMFVDIYLPQPAQGEAMHALAADQSDLRIPNLNERDKLFNMYEYHVDLELDCDREGAGARKLKNDDTGVRPYLVVVDASTQEVLMCRRNWKKNDKSYAKRIWFAHHKFLPGLGFYGWGYPHVIGSLGLAASGAVNALLDSALAANFQGGFVSKEAKISGEFRLEHGVWKQCDSSAEDLAKSFYTPPFKEPSPALFQLLDQLVGAAQRFSGTTDAAVGDGNNTGPVGTTVALIEQAQKPMSAIHKRLHVSMSQELKMLCELIEDFMGDRYDYKIGDEEQFLLKTDFGPGTDVVCVTDPGVSSDTQRVMRAQAVLELIEKAPNLYPPEHQAEAHRRMLVALKVPNLDAIGPKVKTPQYLDPVAENANMLNGTQVRVYPTQDDQAHIVIHQDGLARAAALYPPEVFEKMIQPAFQAHIRDHMAKAYLKQVFTAAGLPMPKFDQDGQVIGEDPAIEAQITQRVATVIAKLPKPQPKPGTPSAEQQEAQQRLQAKAAEAKQALDNKEQAFQAEEKRKQEAFDNEERRKDQALNYQEARLDTVQATDMNRKQAGVEQDVRHTENKHVQDLVHGSRAHEHKMGEQVDAHGQKLAHGDNAHLSEQERKDQAHAAEQDRAEEAHRQQLEQGQEGHEQQLEQGGEAHAQSLEQGQESHESGLEQQSEAHAQSLKEADEVAKAAASEEAEADSHMGRAGVK
jgi:hypothetical protein